MDKRTSTIEKQKKFSIIIPVYREFDTINICLQSLVKLERMEESEVIIVDGDDGSTMDHAVKTDYPYPLKSVMSEKGRGQQLNRGAEAANGSYFVFLHVDTSMPLNALSLIEESLKSYAAGSFSLGIDSKRLFLRLGNLLANIRSNFSRIPFGDQVHFIRSDVFFGIGGYQNIPIMEDVALMLELKKRGMEIQIRKEKIITSDRRWKKEGMIKATIRNWFLYATYRIGVPVEKLSSRYIPHAD
jgi:rSAM/selenodomain-associated transferase 2